MLLELGVPPLSIASQLYQPARPLPICTIHGHTRSAGASMVMAWVDVKIGLGDYGVHRKRAPPFESRVAKQVASATSQKDAFTVPA